MKTIKHFVAASATTAMLLAYSVMPVGAVATPEQPIDVTGSYDIHFFLTGDPTAYAHDADLTQTGSDVTGNGGHPANGAHVYEWEITEGSLTGNVLDLMVDYTAGPDTEETVMHMKGTVHPDGSMSGEWTDNHGGGTRTGTWETVAGVADVYLPEACDGMTLDGDWIVGTNGSDTLDGTSGNDMIIALGGSDIINGMGGHDCILSGAGSDWVSAGNGDDVVLAGAGSDYVQGNNGQDSLHGEGGTDSLDGGDNADDLYGGDGTDSLNGGLGGDDLWGGAGSDYMSGDAGNDTLDGQGGTDFANGGTNNDTCTAEAKTQCEV